VPRTARFNSIRKATFSKDLQLLTQAAKGLNIRQIEGVVGNAATDRERMCHRPRLLVSFPTKTFLLFVADMQQPKAGSADRF
jgi:hypothetical protein